MIATAMRPLRTAHQDRVGCAEQRVRVPIAGHDGFARRMIHTRVEPVHEVLAAVPGTRILTVSVASDDESAPAGLPAGTDIARTVWFGSTFVVSGGGGC